MKKTFNSFDDFTSLQKINFDIIQHIAFDVNSIHKYLIDSMHTTDTTEISSLRSLVNSIITLIINHSLETENKENSITQEKS